MFTAVVEHREVVILEPTESKGGRIFVGLISAGPVGAIATANTEEGFSQPKAYKYLLNNGYDKQKTIISRSIVNVGACVEVISPDDSDIEILKISEEEKC